MQLNLSKNTRGEVVGVHVGLVQHLQGNLPVACTVAAAVDTGKATAADDLL
jgi:hypothetical protein